MTEEKHVAEWLRERSQLLRTLGEFSCRDFMTYEFGISSPCTHPRSCRDCYADMFERIADRIDAERALPEGIDAERALPDGVQWPRFEDVEPVKVGDEVEYKGETMRVYLATFDADGWSLWCSRDGIDGRLSGSYGERVKRPAPKVLDADGVPIKVGDIVYRDDDPEPLQVDLIYDGSTGYCTVRLKDSAGIYKSADAPRLSHKKPEPPDSWEKLEKDARKTACVYAPAPHDEDGLTTCDGCPFQKSESCSNEMTIDLVERAKKLAGIEEEARND